MTRILLKSLLPTPTKVERMQERQEGVVRVVSMKPGRHCPRGGHAREADGQQGTHRTQNPFNLCLSKVEDAPSQNTERCASEFMIKSN